MTNARTAKSARDKAAELRAQAARKEARRRSAIALGVVTVVIALIVTAFAIVRSSAEKTSQGLVNPANVSSDGSIVVGKASAPVTLVAYEDFQCPACQAFEEGSASQIQQWISAGTLKVEYRPIAFLDRMSSTNYSSRALNAAAAVANSAPSAFAKFHALLFEHQPKEGSAGLTDDQLIQYAADAGAPEPAIRAAVQNGSYDSWVTKVTDAASKANVTETPTLIVNGSKLSGYDPAVLKQAVEAAAK
jgi:protein-disulfide isomerase